MANKLSDKSTSQLNAMLNKGSGASQKEVRPAITELKKCGEDTPPPSLVMGGRREICLLYTSPSPRDRQKSRMPSSA